MCLSLPTFYYRRDTLSVKVASNRNALYVTNAFGLLSNITRSPRPAYDALRKVVGSDDVTMSASTYNVPSMTREGRTVTALVPR